MCVRRGLHLRPWSPTAWPQGRARVIRGSSAVTGNPRLAPGANSQDAAAQELDSSSVLGSGAAPRSSYTRCWRGAEAQ